MHTCTSVYKFDMWEVVSDSLVNDKYALSRCFKILFLNVNNLPCQLINIMAHISTSRWGEPGWCRRLGSLGLSSRHWNQRVYNTQVSISSWLELCRLLSIGISLCVRYKIQVSHRQKVIVEARRRSQDSRRQNEKLVKREKSPTKFQGQDRPPAPPQGC